MMTLRASGRIVRVAGRAMVSARCPLCGREHRYDKGPAGGEAAAAVEAQGYSEEWLPCQYDLPGNFWRIELRGNGRGGPGANRNRRNRRGGRPEHGGQGEQRDRPGRPA